MKMTTTNNKTVSANSGVPQVMKNMLAAVLLAAGCASAIGQTAPNAAPEVKLVSMESNGATPAVISLEAQASDSDGAIAQVEFFSGGTLIGSAVQAPFTLAWTNVPAGTYAITAKATDNLGLASETVATSVVVGTSSVKAYYIHSDQIDTARLITDTTGQAVWQTDLDPFGANPPDENPTALGNFQFNNRFPGQYFDQESGLHYNYFRDYDPQTGRYVQSDPIGLAGGINTYGYVEANPVGKFDPLGLQSEGDLSPRRPGRLPGPTDVLVPGTKSNTDFGRALWRLFKSTPAASEATPAEKADKDYCISVCYPILERPKRGFWDDRNEVDFHQCVKDCMEARACK